MATLLGGVSLVVLMSEFETHPLVALEAAAAGRRLLVADAGGLGEIAEDGFAPRHPARLDPASRSPPPRSRSWRKPLPQRSPQPHLLGRVRRGAARSVRLDSIWPSRRTNVQRSDVG